MFGGVCLWEVCITAAASLSLGTCPTRINITLFIFVFIFVRMGLTFVLYEFTLCRCDNFFCVCVGVGSMYLNNAEVGCVLIVFVSH